MSSREQPRLPVLEFWPDYGDGTLWEDGGAVDADALGLAPALAARLAAFGEAYQEGRLPLEGPGDPDYLAEGQRLLAAVRESLADRYRVVVLSRGGTKRRRRTLARPPRG